ncbi:zinc finger, CCHC-type containing protein [Tanacetum coccineum]|uniref:Zinc finger, CCHC-type containing protein n=1 Tax=Tanacetum coccineum TaxID=301880 RepID=A0ABQ5I3N7_9ASTR
MDFKIKLKVDGTISKFKARLVIQGFKQKSGIDYFDTYAPVSRISTVRLLIVMASIHNLIIHQMDVETAFLNGDLDEEVYMNQPHGFIMPGNENKAVSQLEYSRVIGFLMYAMTCTRPDIAFVVGKLSRYTSNPGTQHWQAIQWVLNYLKKTMDYRLTYTGYPSVLEGYTDASWISNTKDNALQSGWVYPLIAPISIRCDSVATLAKAYSQMHNRKSRHLGVRHNMIRELITNGMISIEFVRSQQNLADHLTKRLARDLVIKSAKGMGLKSN